MCLSIVLTWLKYLSNIFNLYTSFEVAVLKRCKSPCEEEKHFYIGLVKELKLKFKELEQWIQKYVTSIN